jgi:hypothetical protein
VTYYINVYLPSLCVPDFIIILLKASEMGYKKTRNFKMLVLFSSRELDHVLVSETYDS